MPEERAKRKLSAILCADVKGYSRLMEHDESLTVQTLKAYREIVTSLIQDYRGRVVDSPGDNVLAEFGSVVDAVEGAVKVQQELKEKNAALPENRKMEFRMGINLGDVIVDGDRIYGDGLNIAARLEGLAEGGGICISGTVFEHIKNKLHLEYDYLGKQHVKNILEPVHVYQVKVNTKTAFSELNKKVKLPDKPSIAVLPFINMSGDPEQTYFSDGITEDLITDLSRVSGLFVIARNSVFTYKGKPVKVQEVGRELGVRYVLEGSVRKSNGKVRITAQLVDATTGGHLWAERYDRNLEDIFALQDEVTKRIVSVLAVKLTEDEQICRACKCKETCNMEAYDYYLKGLEHFSRITREANLDARKMFEKSIEVDPQYAPAISQLGTTYLYDWTYGWEDDLQLLEKAFNLAQQAMTLDDSLSDAHSLLGYVYLWKREHQKAISETEKAVALEPNNADWLVCLGDILTWDERPDKALGLIKKAMRLNPKHPGPYLWSLGHSYFLMKQYEEAISSFKRALNINPNYHPSHFYLAASYSELGKNKEARAQIAELLHKWPVGCLEAARKRLPYKTQTTLKRVLNAVSNAGLM